MRRLLLLVLLVSPLDALALSRIRENPQAMEYVKRHWDFVHRAILNNSYSELVKFAPYILLGQDLLKKYPFSTSLAHSVLVGALWDRRLFRWQAYDFSFSDLSFADFDWADLTKSNLKYAKLWHGKLCYAKLQCQTITGADFSYANLRYATIQVGSSTFYAWKDVLDFCGALYNDATIMISPLRRTRRLNSSVKTEFSIHKLTTE
ncbi:MAG TPA: pentapeptide repeat-containing protein [Myxococcota bacterium]|nr:pentapeptide repeat-containing protein [Myxococcota bacterium]